MPDAPQYTDPVLAAVSTFMVELGQQHPPNKLPGELVKRMRGWFRAQGFQVRRVLYEVNSGTLHASFQGEDIHQ